MVLRKASREQSIRDALDSLRRIVRALRLSAAESEKTLGISMVQQFVLLQLGDGQPRSIAELARKTFTDPSSVSVVVQRLVDRKLIVRRVDHGDARRAQLTLSAAGRRLVARAPAPVQERLLDALADLPDRRLAELTQTLDRLARALGPAKAGLFFEDEPRPRRSRRSRTDA